MNFGDQFFSQAYRYSPVGLIILDENFELVDANEYMLDSFDQKQQPLAGKCFGKAFGCVLIAENEKSCGETAGCSVCDFRDAITSVLLHDARITDQTVSHAFKNAGVRSLKWFKLGARALSTPGGKFAIVSFADITAEKRDEQLLRDELAFDPATGAVSKKHLADILTDISRYINRYKTVSVGIIDMDDFKNINDNYGHLIGDEVLQSFSEIARQNIRKQDILGRFGGEEFMMVLPGAGIRQVSMITKRISDTLRQRFEARNIGGVSFSAGFIELHSEVQSHPSKEEIISAADTYLYQAKRSGKSMLVSKDFSMKF